MPVHPPKSRIFEFLHSVENRIQSESIREAVRSLVEKYPVGIGEDASKQVLEEGGMCVAEAVSKKGEKGMNEGFVHLGVKCGRKKATSDLKMSDMAQCAGVVLVSAEAEKDVSGREDMAFVSKKKNKAADDRSVMVSKLSRKMNCQGVLPLGFRGGQDKAANKSVALVSKSKQFGKSACDSVMSVSKPSDAVGGGTIVAVGVGADETDADGVAADAGGDSVSLTVIDEDEMSPADVIDEDEMSSADVRAIEIVERPSKRTRISARDSSK